MRLCYLACTVILAYASGMFRHIQALFKSIFTHMTLRYIHNIILNIFTKAQSWTFGTNLNAPLFYRCYLTSAVTLHILNVIFQDYSGIFKTCSAIFNPDKEC